MIMCNWLHRTRITTVWGKKYGLNAKFRVASTKLEQLCAHSPYDLEIDLKLM